MSTEAIRYHHELPPIPPSFSVKEVIVAGDRGPCGGVNMAITGIDKILTMVNGREPVFANNPPVHNKLIVEEFTKRGLIIEPDINKIPEGSIWVSSAHGLDLNQFEQARKRNNIIINLECQLVTKIKKEAIRTEEGNGQIVFFGTSGHPEPQAVLSVIKNKARVIFIDTESALDKIKLTDVPVRILNHTTLSTRGIDSKVEALRKINPDITIPNPIGICYATDNRQNSVYEIFNSGSKPIDFLLVVGSQNSHNAQELKNIGTSYLGEEKTKLVDTPKDIALNWFTKDIQTVGLTSGASVLDKYTEDILRYFQINGAKIVFRAGKEKDTTFKLPEDDFNALNLYLTDKYKI
jgi:4-hydroxy-3-methylbut-2-enyl diphosphate reductase